MWLILRTKLFCFSHQAVVVEEGREGGHHIVPTVVGYIIYLFTRRRLMAWG